MNSCLPKTQDNLIPFVDGKCSLESVYRLEDFLKSIPGADTSAEAGGDVEHHFSDGLYARQLTMPADTFIVGELHLKGQINFLMKGEIAVTTDEGVKILKAPQIVVSSAFTKRAGYAITETVWVTVSATDKTTVDEVRADILATGKDDPRLGGLLCLGEQ